MTETEQKLTQEHAAYWKELADKRIAIVFGPVFDPKGAWGVGIVEVDDEADVQALSKNDPTMKSGMNFHFEVYPMPQVVLRK